MLGGGLGGQYGSMKRREEPLDSVLPASDSLLAIRECSFCGKLPVVVSRFIYKIANI